MDNLTGRCAIVTGAAQGLGKAVALRLANDGATVIGADLQAEKLSQVTAEFASTGRRMETISGDVGKAETATAIVKRAL